MRNLTRDLRIRFTTLLAIWMAVTACGVSLSHVHAVAPRCHEHGCHEHGLGWNQTPTTIDQPTSESCHPHQHFVLLGFEFTSEMSIDHTPTVPGAVQFEPVIDAHSPGFQSDGLPVLYDLSQLLVAIDPSEFPSAQLNQFSPTVPLSAFASRSVSGVLRP